MYTNINTHTQYTHTRSTEWLIPSPSILLHTQFEPHDANTYSKEAIEEGKIIEKIQQHQHCNPHTTDIVVVFAANHRYIRWHEHLPRSSFFFDKKNINYILRLASFKLHNIYCRLPLVVAATWPHFCVDFRSVWKRILFFMWYSNIWKWKLP